MKRASKSAAKLILLENGDPISAETEAIQSRIRQRAFELSLTRPGHASELYDWIMAESEIMSVPQVRLIEKNGTFEARFALAGMKPEDVNVMMTAEQILIKGEFNEERESVEGTVHISDFKSSTVFRSVALPQPIDTTTATIDFQDGLLRVTAAKASSRQAPPKRAAPARKTSAKKKAG